MSYHSTTPSTQEFIDALFRDLQSSAFMQETPSMTQLASLDMLFGSTLTKALELVENNQVRCYKSMDSANRVYTVTSKGTKTKEECTYVVLPYHYCPCDSFGYHVVMKKMQIYCKHILAVWLANAMEKNQVIESNDEELRNILKTHMQ